MKLLFFTDLHVTRSAEFSRPTEDGLTEYLQQVKRSYQYLKEVAWEVRPEFIAFGGDLWDSHDYVDTVALNVAFQIFEDLSSWEWVSGRLAVVGNHDYYSIEHRIHTLEFLKGFDWYVADKPTTLGFGDWNIGLLPYRDQYTDKELKDACNKKTKLVLAHSNVVGGRLRAPKDDTDTYAYARSGVSPDKLKALVLNGHFHHSSWPSENWFNVGSFMSRTFHDKDSPPRGFAIYDSDSGEVQFYENPHARAFTEIRIDTEDQLTDLLDQDFSRTYVKLHYNAELEDSVLAASEVFAGARLLPYVQKPDAPKPQQFDFRFSLEQNLEGYLREEYDDPELADLGLEIFRKAAGTYEASAAREPLDFGKLEVHNYLSIGHLELDLRPPGLSLLVGVNDEDPEQSSNGAGKSSVIEAVYWCLTGKSLRGYKGNDVISWGAEHCRVSLELFVGDKVYTVVRTRKDPELRTGVKLFVGGASAGARLSKHTEASLEDLLGRSERALQHIGFLTADMSARFSALGYSGRAQLLEEIVDSKPYSIAQQLSDEQCKDANGRYLNLRGQIKATEASLESAKVQLGQCTADLDHYDSTVAEEIASIETKLEELNSAGESYEEELAALADEPDVDDQLSAIEFKTVEYDEIIEAKAEQLKLNLSDAAVAKSEIARISKLLSQIRCLECGAPIDRAGKRSKLSEQEDKLTRLTTSIAEYQRVIKHVSDRKNLLQEKRASILNARRLQAEKKSQVQAQLDRVKGSAWKLQQRQTELEHKRDILLERKRSVSKDLEHYKADLEVIAVTAREQKQLVDRLFTLASDVFSEQGVRNALLAQVAIPYINSRLPEYSSRLLGGKQVLLSSQRLLKRGSAKNDIDIVQSGNRTYTGNSSGERRRVDLCIQFALNDLAVATGRSRFGFLAVDEVLDKLDDRGIYAVKQVLDLKASQIRVLMVTHSKYAASISSNRIVLVKRSGITHLEHVHEPTKNFSY